MKGVLSINQRLSGSPESSDLGRMAEVALHLAGEVLAAEERIKEELLAAAERGDCRKVAEIVRRWQTEPPVEVAAGLGR